MTPSEIYASIIFCWAAFLILLALKVAGYIAWSWWIVTAPIWGPYLILAVVGVALWKKL